MILYTYGTDTFRSRQYLKQSVDQFKKQRDPQGYNVAVLDGKTVAQGTLLAEINAAPFLAEKRMIVIENILSSSNKELLQHLIDLISQRQFPERNIVIFWQGEPIGKVKEVKELQILLQKEKYAQEFAPLDSSKLGAWIQKEVVARGGAIAAPAIQYLSLNTAGDMWQLTTLIDQLVAYAGGQEITMPDAALFIDEKVDDNVFNMIEAMVSGNKKQAFKLLAEQRRIGEEDSKLFGLFIWQFRIMLEIADLLATEPHTTSDSAAKLLGIHPFVAKKNFAVARKFSLSAMQKMYQKLLDIDVKTKTGQGDQRLLTDVFVAMVG